MSEDPPVSLRPVRPADEPFLLALFESVRGRDLGALGPHAGQLLEMQFRAQRRHYAAAHPEAEEQIVVLEDRPIGRLWVDRSTDPWRLLDLAMIDDARGAGLGTSVLRDLLDDADRAGARVALQVAVTNAGALRLYERLGFRRIGEDEVYVSMDRRPGEAGGQAP
jgi:ribosomal protein S18 acetylase RimI-like enzyme